MVNGKEPEGNVEIKVEDRRGQQRDPEPEPDAQQAQPEAQPQQLPTAEAKCGQCGATIYLKLPTLRVINAPEVSMVLVPHERPQVCQKCGRGYVPIIRGVNNGQMDIQFAPVEVQQQPIVVPANQQQVRAVETTRQRAKGLVIPN